MIGSSCPQCGFRAFAVATGRQHVECDRCGGPLGPWEHLLCAAPDEDGIDDEGAFRAYAYLGDLSARASTASRRPA